MKQDGFKELKVWQKAKELAARVYKVSDAGRLGKDFGLRDQIRRAAVSVPSNIAEGDERKTNRESVRFLYIAKGSVAEIRTQIEIASEIGHIGESVFRELDDEYSRLGKMIGSLRQAETNKIPRSVRVGKPEPPDLSIRREQVVKYFFPLALSEREARGERKSLRVSSTDP